MSLPAADVARSRARTVLVAPLGPHVRVCLAGRTWITRSQAEVTRVLALGGAVAPMVGARAIP